MYKYIYCQVVYWSDVEEGIIYQSSLAGTGDKEVFLNRSNGIGIVDGGYSAPLAPDFSALRVYTLYCF